MAKDPDAPGTINHSLYLYNPDGTYNMTINSGFYSSDDSNINILYNTTAVSDGQYRMNVTAVADDKPNNVRSIITPENFTIDNTNPLLTITSSNNTTYYSVPPIDGLAFDINPDEIYANDSEWIWNGNYTDWSFTNNEDVAIGTHHVLITAIDSAGNSNSSLFVFTLSSESGRQVPVFSSTWCKVLLLVIMSGLLWFKRRSPPR